MTKVIADAYIAKANKHLENLRVAFCNYDFPVFGSNMLSHHNFSNETAAAITQCHRINSKFFEPSTSHESELREKCFLDWIAYEDTLRKNRLYARLPNGKRSVYKADWWNHLSAEVKRNLFKAREALHDLYNKFTIDLHNCDVEFTPGETDWSSGGRVSVLQKLKNKENWTVTADAFDDFARAVYHNASLKRSAKAHFATLTKRELLELHREFKHSGFDIFRARLMGMVTITYGSVGDSVFKNNEKRRFINKEPMGNMILQRLVANKLRYSIDRDWTNCLQTGQERHKKLISQQVATIDFSNASDSIMLDLVWFLFPAALRKYLLKWRSDFVLLDDVWYQPEKLCSMGNGFCFEILTLTLLSIARTLDSHSSVYGDDVIIDNEVAIAFCDTMRAVGFTVNDKKSFISSEFRESCGAYFYDRSPNGYLVTFDFHWIETQTDYVIACNKLCRISDALPPGSVKELVHKTWQKLLSVCPPSLCGPITRGESLDSYVMHPRYSRVKREDPLLRELRAKLIEDCALALYAYNIELNDVYVLTRKEFHANILTPIKRHVTCPFTLGHYMYGNRVCDDRIRGRPNGKTNKERRGFWVAKNYFILPSGLQLPCKELINYHNEMMIALMCALKVGASLRSAVAP